MRKFALLFSAAIMSLATPAMAVVVGFSGGGNCYPFNCNNSGTSVGESYDYYQIYSSAAFSGPLTFDTISFFDYVDLGFKSRPVLNGNYVISFGVTSEPVGGTYPVGSITNLAEFFNGPLGGSSVGGVFSISGTAFSYNPLNGNLVMHLVASDQDLVPNGFGNGYFQADYAGLVTSRAVMLSNGIVVEGDGALVTEFHSANAVPEPATWAMMIAGFAGIGATMRRRKVASAVYFA
jgi:hypothetical protein